MRDSSFDQLARGLASGSISRGKAIRLMSAALLGGTLASMPGVALADDECKRDGKKCRKNNHHHYDQHFDEHDIDFDEARVRTERRNLHRGRHSVL
jgi:hypothetical protein